MSKMFVELANLYRQLIYIWDRGVESPEGVRAVGMPESTTEAICAILFHLWAWQICNKGSGYYSARDEVELSLVRRTCVVNIAIPWTIIMPEPRGCFPLSLPLLSCATLCHLICCNLIDNLCNFNEHARFI